MTTENSKETAVAAPVNQAQKLTAVALFNRDDIKKKFEALLGQKAQGFIVSVLQAITSNKLLKDADPISVYNAAAVAATLDLPINQNLGFAYIIPYTESFQVAEIQKDAKGKETSVMVWKKRQVAQFQMGYKGFIQLAQRSGLFKTISATPIYEGQLIESNPLTGFIFDFTKRDSDKIIGYAGYFALLNGFEKTMYATVEELGSHAKRYSQSFKYGSGIWKDNFDAMAIKTVLKLLLSKYAPLSIEMQLSKAITVDQAVINNDEGTDITYTDHTEVETPPADKEKERIELLIGDAATIEDLKALEPFITEELRPMYEATLASLTPDVTDDKNQNR